jgi:hypothetical protein
MEDQFYCIISKDLLFFLKWIAEHNSPILKKFINKIYKNGFYDFYLNSLKEESMSEKEIENVVLNFFDIIEATLNKSINERPKSSGYIEKSTSEISNIASCELMNIVNKNCISETINEEIKINEIKDLFLKEFLENWNPKNKIIN